MALTVKRPPEGKEPPTVNDHNPYLNGRGSQQRKSFQGFMRAVRDTLDPERQPHALDTIHKVYGSQHTHGSSGVAKAILGEGSGQFGGYIVPTEYSTSLLRVISEESWLLPRVTRVPMGSLETQCPLYQTRVTSGTVGVPSFYGNMVYKWGRSQAPLETEPAFEQLDLIAWDLIGYSTVSNDFLMDAGEDAEQSLVRMFGSAAAWYLEYAFIAGSGSAQQMPTGILQCPGKKLVNRTTGGSIVVGDIANMAAALLPFSWRNAVWAISTTSLAKLALIANFVLNQSDPGDGSVGLLMSRPLFITDKLPPLGTQGDLILFDPSLYVWGARQEVVVDVSMHPGFQSNQTDFRVWLRADGKPEIAEPITLQDQSTVVSPYVILN